jgi:hypothetical protein
MNEQKLIELSTSLSLKDMTFLINLFYKDIHFYVGSRDNCVFSADFASMDDYEPAILNGHSIQLNLDADIEEFIRWSNKRIAEIKRENKAKEVE